MQLSDLRALAHRIARGDGVHAAGSAVRVHRRSARTAPAPIAFGAKFGLILEGQKRFKFSGQVVDCEPGTFMLGARKSPAICGVTRAPYLALMFELDPACVSRALRSRAGRSNPASILGVGQASDELVAAVGAFVERPEHADQGAVIDALAATAIGAELLEALVAEAIADPLVERAAALIDAELAAPLSIEALARRVGASVSSLHHRFKRATGTSPLQFQKQRRLAYARDLLAIQRLGAGEAARAVGYASASQFSRDYRKAFAVPPAADARVRRDAFTRRAST